MTPHYALNQSFGPHSYRVTHFKLYQSTVSISAVDPDLACGVSPSFNTSIDHSTIKNLLNNYRNLEMVNMSHIVLCQCAMNTISLNHESRAHIYKDESTCTSRSRTGIAFPAEGTSLTLKPVMRRCELQPSVLLSKRPCRL